MNRTDDGSPYSLVMNFPKKIFQPSDMDKTLKELGKENGSVDFYKFISFRISPFCCADLGQATITTLYIAIKCTSDLWHFCISIMIGYSTTHLQIELHEFLESK